MKKLLMSLFSVSMLSLTVFAQDVPDGGFENWRTGKTYSGETFYEIDGNFWATLNMLSTLPPELFTGPVTAFRETGRNGYCAKLVSDKLVTDTTEIFLPGVIGTITVRLANASADFGRPYAFRPTNLKGYIKYAPVAGDSASVYIELFKFDGTRRKTIGRSEQIVKNAITEWTAFDLPIKYNSNEMPDSINVMFVSSAGFVFENLFECKGQVGSTLWVDDVVLSDGTSNEISKTEFSFSVYPNPAQDYLQLDANTDVQGAKLNVFDMSGRLVKETNLQGQSTRLDISNLSKGMYTFRIQNGTKMIHTGKFSVVR